MSASAPLPDPLADAKLISPTEPLRVAVLVADPTRAELLRNALSIHPGIRLTDETGQAEVVITDVPSSPASPHATGSRSVAPEDAVPPTPREREVLELLALGASNKMIARRLGISLATVKFHVAALLLKLGARSRSDAIAIAARRGVLLL